LWKQNVLNINRLLSGFVLSIIAVGMIAVALISVQNAAPVSLKFLIWESVPLPAGLLLAIALSSGILVGGAIPGWQRRR
jgi:uncharacterized integral membrane protein